MPATLRQHQPQIKLECSLNYCVTVRLDNQGAPIVSPSCGRAARQKVFIEMADQVVELRIR
jgi:hypothetical protein